MRPDPLSTEIRIRMLAQRHRCRVLPFGRAWRVVGPGVDLLLADLVSLRPSDLEPVALVQAGAWPR